MMSRKIYMTIAVEPEIVEELKEEALKEMRTKSAMAEKILKDYFKSKEQGVRYGT